MINKKLLIISTILAMAVSFSADANKPIYKWKDSQGNIKYTQSKPPRGTEFETIYQRQSNSEEKTQTSNSKTSESVDAQEQMLSEQKTEKQRVQKANKEITKKNCMIAQNNLDTLTNSARVFTETDGERRLLTDQERSDKLEVAQANVDKYCNK